MNIKGKFIIPVYTKETWQVMQTRHEVLTLYRPQTSSLGTIILLFTHSFI